MAVQRGGGESAKDGRYVHPLAAEREHLADAITNARHVSLACPPMHRNRGARLQARPDPSSF